MSTTSTSTATVQPNFSAILLQAVIQCAAALKRRQPPDSALHDSVGTQADLAARVEARKSLASLRLTPDLLEPYTMSMEQLQTWGFFTSVPSEVGGVEPSLEGKIATCDRCAKPFRVKRMEEADECEYHWGRQMTTRINGTHELVTFPVLHLTCPFLNWLNLHSFRRTLPSVYMLLPISFLFRSVHARTPCLPGIRIRIPPFSLPLFAARVRQAIESAKYNLRCRSC